MSLRYAWATVFCAAGAVLAQPAAPTASPGGEFVVAPGTRIPLGLINSVTTKNAREGDRVYLETVFPILAGGRIVIPPGSYVAGTVLEVKRPGRVKGRGELLLRFDSLTLPNGVTRDFRARLGGIDGRGGEEFDRTEGKVRSEGNKAGDAGMIAGTAVEGTTIGLLAGSAAKNMALGGGIGAAAGATAGLMAVLLSRGPDAILAKGSTIEMVTDRPLEFQRSELDFGMTQAGHFSDGPGPRPVRQGAAWRYWPF